MPSMVHRFGSFRSKVKRTDSWAVGLYVNPVEITSWRQWVVIPFPREESAGALKAAFMRDFRRRDDPSATPPY